MIENQFNTEFLHQNFPIADRAKAEKTLPKWLFTEGGILEIKIENSALKGSDAELFWQYIFYKMSQSKDLLPDLEIYNLLNSIDKNTSQPFANGLLKTYCQSGAEAKFKFLLPLSMLLGGAEEVAFLQKKISEWADNQRGKMAEYAVKSLALNGSQKAWRAIDFCSRKYKSKSKNVGAAAVEAFAIAAKALDISPHELADSIIPDFGFDNLFLNFEANGDDFRAFINSDFKLAFLDEDGELLKNPPRGTSTSVKDQFKEIAKEIREVVKSQTPRLEHFLVIQRRWTIEKWQALFMQNPIMFAYANRLIWGIFDEKDALNQVFRVEQDQTIVNADYDELNFDDFDPLSKIGLIHPLRLNSEQIELWKNTLFDQEITAPFPQLERKTVVLDEKDRHIRLSKNFKGQLIGGYTFISRMDKMGWSRGSIVDNGFISTYYKDFSDFGIIAIIRQDDGVCVGYYDVNAELGDLMFVRRGSVGFGSYSYDEPTHEGDPRLVKLSDVPPIVYSEVMADLMSLK